MEGKLKKILGSILFGILLVVGVVYAASIPTVGGDSGTWGTVLNEFLQVAHDDDGNIATDAVNTTMIDDGTITGADIAADGIDSSGDIKDGTVADADIASISTAGKVSGAAITSGKISGSASVDVSGVVTTSGNLGSVDTEADPGYPLMISHSEGDSPIAYLYNSDLDGNANGNPLMSLVHNQGSGLVTGADSYIKFYAQGDSIGDISGSAEPGTIVYNTFTGSHWSETSEENLRLGEILVSDGTLIANSNHLPHVERTNIAENPRVYGVYGGYIGNNDAAYGTGKLIQVLSLGTGRILVTDTNGDINNGDLITTSTRVGYGQKQSDDLIHSYTVAKATESINWEEVAVDPEADLNTN